MAELLGVCRKKGRPHGRTSRSLSEKKVGHMAELLGVRRKKKVGHMAELLGVRRKKRSATRPNFSDFVEKKVGQMAELHGVRRKKRSAMAELLDVC